MKSFTKISVLALALLAMSSCSILGGRWRKRTPPPPDMEMLPMSAMPTLPPLPTSRLEDISTVYKIATKPKVHTYSQPIFYAVTQPYQKMRNDRMGDGHFGASRGHRRHHGLDIVVTPGSLVYAPIEGVITRMAYPYGKSGGNARWEGIVIEGTGSYHGYQVKIFYMNPFTIGQHVYPNTVIGQAQAISKKYSSSMIDHLHVEVRLFGQLVDPSTLFDLIE